MKEVSGKPWSNNSGSIIITVAPFIAIIAILIGGFIDFGRGNINRSETLGAIDAAALAAATMPSEFVGNTADRISVAERYYNYNVNEIFERRVEFSDLNIDIIDVNGTIDVSVDATNSIETTFLKTMDMDRLSTSSSTRVAMSRSKASVMDSDIVFVGDMSTSMKARDAALKEKGNARSRVHQMMLKSLLLLDSIFPLDEEGNRIELSTVRFGAVTYNRGVKTFFGNTSGADAFPGDSLRSSYDDAYRFITQRMNYDSITKGGTCGACGMQKGIELFESARLRSDGVLNSAAKFLIFLTDGRMNNPGGKKEAEAAFLAQCKDAKDKNIIVFTIAFGQSLAVNNKPDDELLECASLYVDENGKQQKRYYLARDAVELENLMTNIIPGVVSQLRIVK